MPQPISVLFLGTSAFAVPSLAALATDGRFRVTAVITNPDRPVGRSQAVTPPAVKAEALKHGLTVLQPEKINAEWEQIKPTLSQPDFVVVVSYGQILNSQILSFPKLMALNVHASLLPELRGASPIQHAILEGRAETGVTIQKMLEQLDAGPMLAQHSVPIGPRETATSLHDRLASLGAGMLVTTLTMPLPKPIAQDPAQVTVCRKLTRSDGMINPDTMDAATIDRMVRALAPWPGVTWGTAKILETSLEPHANALALPCKNGSTLYVISIQPASKNPMTGREYAHGHLVRSRSL